ncbi:MAG: hypothetical protein NVS2B14_06770 [Chamaesiphon sp.]
MKARLLFIGLSLLLYRIALSLPCLLFNIVPVHGASGVDSPTGKLNAYGNPDNIYQLTGIELTIAGAFGLIFFLFPAVGWLANPAYWLSCILFAQQQYSFSVISALAAIILGLVGTVSAFWIKLPNGDSPFTELALNRLLPGFWLWLAAPGFLLFISSYYVYRDRSNRG